MSQPILVIEDEYLIATDLAQQIIEDGGQIAGPAMTMKDAFLLLDQARNLGSVILDVKVGGETTFALADILQDAGVPFVFFTGYRSLVIPARFIAVPRILKPATWQQLKQALLDAIARLEDAGQGSFRESIEAALPRLRQRARNMVDNPEIADRLVEHTLERAISAVESRSFHASIEDWLLNLLETSSRDAKRQLLH